MQNILYLRMYKPRIDFLVKNLEITRIYAALDFTCVKVKYLRLHSRHFVARSIYGNLSVMSRSSDFWESMVLAALMQSKCANTRPHGTTTRRQPPTYSPP
jgi:hypothetical protein